MNILIKILLFLSCVAALHYSGALDQEIRKALLESLRRIQQNECPLYSPDLTVESSVKSSASDIPSHIFGRFLESKSIKSLRKATVKDMEYLKQLLKIRLFNFNPHFVFKSDILNELLLAFLDKHFPNSPDLDSDHIKDELQVLILKWNYDHLNYDPMPKNIYFYLIAFINGAVYGANSTVPVEQLACRVDSLRFVRMNTGKCARTIEYCTDFIENDTKFPRAIEFFSTNRDKDDLREIFSIKDINSWRLYTGDVEVEIVIFEIFIDEFTDKGILKLCTPFLGKFGYSPLIIDRLISIEDINTFGELYLNQDEPILALAYFSKLRNTSSQLQLLDEKLNAVYAFFEMANFFEMPLQRDQFPVINDQNDASKMVIFLSCFITYANLYKLELFSRCIKSDLIDSNEYFDAVHRLYRTNTLIFEIAIKESPHPFRLYYPRAYQHQHDFTIYFSCLKEESSTMVFKLLNSDDPIILLFLEIGFLSRFKSFITDKFNLNKTYLFDSEEFLFGMNCFNTSICKFSGKTMHFKQIVKELDEPKLFGIFSSNTREFEGEFEADLSHSPIQINIDIGSQYFRH